MSRFPDHTRGLALRKLRQLHVSFVQMNGPKWMLLFSLTSLESGPLTEHVMGNVTESAMASP
jgi:hypothetical protein